MDQIWWKDGSCWFLPGAGWKDHRSSKCRLLLVQLLLCYSQPLQPLTIVKPGRGVTMICSGNYPADGAVWTGLGPGQLNSWRSAVVSEVLNCDLEFPVMITFLSYVLNCFPINKCYCLIQNSIQLKMSLCDNCGQVLSSPVTACKCGTLFFCSQDCYKAGLKTHKRVCTGTS